MTLEERYAAVLSYFEKELPDPFGELRHRNSFELLVAVILSAQCTDVRVNQVTPALFAAYPDAQRMARATPILTANPSIWCRWPVCSWRSMVGRYPRAWMSFSVCLA